MTVTVTPGANGGENALIDAGGIKLNLEFTANAVAAGQTFMSTVEQAATLLSQAITDQITLNIRIDDGPVPNKSLSFSDGGFSGAAFISYTDVRNDLINNKTANDTTFASLPAGPTIQADATAPAYSSVLVTDAQLKLLGIALPSNYAGLDGHVEFGPNVSASNLLGIALHELTHALGRVDTGAYAADPSASPDPDIFDLFRFTSPGVRLFEGGASAPKAYFSLDNGVTNLADYGQSSDPSDFLDSFPITYPPSSTADPASVRTPFDTFDQTNSALSVRGLTLLDLQQLDALGYHVNTGVDDESAAGSGVYVDLTNQVVYTTTAGSGFAGALDATPIVSTTVLSNVSGVTGSAFADRIYGGANTRTIDGGGGDDIIYGGSAAAINDGDGNVTVIGSGVITLGNGGDFVELSNGVASSVGLGNGSDIVYGGDVGSKVIFGTGADSFYASTGADQVVFSAGSGAHEIYGDGQTSLDYSMEGAGIVAILDGDYVGHDGVGDYATGIQKIRATNYGDRIEGSSTTTTIVDGGGNNVIYGGAATSISAGNGANTIIVQTSSAATVTVGSGDNLIEDQVGAANITVGSGSNIIYTHGGSSILTLGTGSNIVQTSTGADLIKISGGAQEIYGDGATNLSYLGETSGITALLDGDYIGHDGVGDYAAGIASIVGTNFNDFMEGASTTSAIVDGDGDNTIYGGGAKQINAGGGNNTIIVQSSAMTTVTAGGGANFVEDFAGAANITLGNGNNMVLLGGAADTLTLGTGANHIEAAGATTINLSGGVDNVYASKVTLDYATSTTSLYVDLGQNLVIDNGQSSYVTGVAKLVGSNNGDRIYAGAGDVTIDGGSGTNVIYAGTGHQTIVGGSGIDKIVDGAAGADVMSGGGGANLFYFTSDAKAAAGTLDTITDFASGVDQLKLLGTGFDNLAGGAAPTLFNIASNADPAYATFAATADAFAFNAATHTLMFNDQGKGGVVNVAQFTGVTSLAAADINIYAN